MDEVAADDLVAFRARVWQGEEGFSLREVLERVGAAVADSMREAHVKGSGGQRAPRTDLSANRPTKMRQICASKVPIAGSRAGVFYEATGKGYKIVEPPVGTLVPSIPEGAATVTVHNDKYFEFGGIWYRPFYSGSDVVYQVVAKPTGLTA